MCILCKYVDCILGTIVYFILYKVCILLSMCNSPGSTLPQLVGAGLEPGIPVREAGALTRNAKGYSL